MAGPTPKESELIVKLRNRVSDLTLKGEFGKDHELLRWIRARECNLDAAENMLRQSLKWREDNDIDNILSWTPPEELVKSCPLEFLGYDDENCPVFLVAYGKWNLKLVAERDGKDAYVKFGDQFAERAREKMLGKVMPTGVPVTQFVCITDCRGLKYKSFASVGVMDMCLEAVRRFEGNHPELTKYYYIINAGAVFAAFFALIKPLLTARTASKLHVYADKRKWLPILLDKVPPSVLPPAYGGTNDQSNSLVLDDADEDEEEEETPYLDVTVPAGEQLTLSFGVEEGNSTITWSFKTDKHDIAFAVNCDGKAYIEKARVNSQEQVQEGKIVCETPGDYIFTFDNSYSRMRTKELSYRVDVRGPSGRKHISF